MVARCRTVAFQGIEVMPVDVQVQLANGLPAFQVVGLADKAVAESRERVRGALGAIGLALPPRRITVNLAPADLPKEGSHYDLPIALALLAAMSVLPGDALDGYVALGELGLDGALGPVSGILPAALHAHGEDRGTICPHVQGGEAAWAGDATRVLAAPTLLALINHFKGTQVLLPPRARIAATCPTCATSRARTAPSGRSKSPRPARITCCSSARPAPASRCWRSVCRASCRRSIHPKSWK